MNLKRLLSRVLYEVADELNETPEVPHREPHADVGSGVDGAAFDA